MFTEDRFFRNFKYYRTHIIRIGTHLKLIICKNQIIFVLDLEKKRCFLILGKNTFKNICIHYP